MKNYLKFIFLSVVIAAGMEAFPAQIGAEVAETAGKNFLLSKNIPAEVLQLAETKTIDGKTLYYIFNTGSKGFVIVTADDNAIPILGYSNESVWTSFADTIYGSNVHGLMESYEKQLIEIKTKNLSASPEIVSQWQNLLSGQPLRTTNAVVTPLLTTTWDQGYPYNQMCPVDASGPGGHVYIGCVGVALAQILKYHNYPNQGIGNYGYQWSGYPYTEANFGATTYNWTNMPNSISAPNTDISTIMYQAAVSCRSMWGAGSTGVSYLNNEDPMTRGLVNYFGCAFAGLKYVEKGWYTASEWDALIQAELVANRPVYYSGDGIGSHSFVCDGVNASAMYHFNFGWGGAYNGYFALSDITPGGSNFSSNQQAIIGIKPNDGSTLVTNTTWTGNINNLTNIAVPDAVTLTVNPGTIAKFAQNCKLQIWGRILATGTAANYAKFTAIDTTLGWWGIKFDNCYMNFEVMADNDTSKVTYAQIEYSDMRAITIKNFSKVLINYCKINNNFIDGDEWGYYNGEGAGIFVHNATVKVYNSEVYNNHALGTGGGIRIVYNNAAMSEISGTSFLNNKADVIGGAFYFQCSILFSNNISDGNNSAQGAGGALGSGNISIVGCYFYRNYTTGTTGKGIALYMTSCDANTNVTNCLIVNNGTTNGFGAGIIYVTNCSPWFVNTTVANNTAGIGAGFVFVNNSDSHVQNCIVYGNVATNYGNNVAINTPDSDPYFDWNDIEGGLAGIQGGGSGGNYTTANYATTNIMVPPQFQNQSPGVGNGYNPANYSWQLIFGSPCIDSGSTTGVITLLPNLDLAGNPRINGIIDMGSYEYTCVPLPVSVSIVASSNPVCAGITVTFTATPINGGTTPAYQWKKGGTNISGATNSTYAYIPANGDAISCVLTSSLTCTTGNPATSNTITMVVTTPLPVSVSIVASSNPVCAGITVTFTATPINGGTAPTYQWKKNGGNVGTNIPTYSYIPVNGDIINCVLTSNLTCTTDNPATSNSISMSVNALPLTDAGSNQSIGYGATAALNGSATGGSGNYSWHWEPASLLINPNIQNPVTVNLTSTAQFTLTVTDVSSTCTGSDQVLVNITGGPLSLMAIATPETSCAGNTVQLMALTGGGTGNYTYSWTSDPVGFNSNIQNPVANPLETTTYTVVVNDGNATLSDLVLVMVNPLPTTPLLPSGPDRVDLVYVSQSQYTTAALANSDFYTWEISPANAGSINGTDTIATVTWNPSNLGNATIRVRSVNGCGESGWSEGKTTRVDNTVGITEPSEQTAILVYPNPNDGTFAIKSPQAINKVILMDALGKTIDEVIAPKPEHRYEYKLAEGVYLVHVYIGEAEYVRKIVVNISR